MPDSPLNLSQSALQTNEVTLSVIVASSGRPTLAATLMSIQEQMKHGDECLISINSDAPWGHSARNQLIEAAHGHAVMFMDDDDIYTYGALDCIRAKFAENPDRMHIFRMMYPDGRVLWEDQKLRCGNVSAQMMVVPRAEVVLYGEPIAHFGDRYEGDYDFALECYRILDEPIWHKETIARIRPHE